MRNNQFWESAVWCSVVHNLGFPGQLGKCQEFWGAVHGENNVWGGWSSAVMLHAVISLPVQKASDMKRNYKFQFGSLLTTEIET